ncbi:MAG: LytR C-terminal domain-containing protein [Mycobacteriaceae bacterium]
MSTPAGGSGLRTGGLVLLGLAVALLIGGLFSLRADDGPSSAQGARPSTTVPTTRAATTTAPATTQPTTQPTTTAPMTTTPVPVPSAPSPATPAPTTQVLTTPAPPPTTVAPPTDPRTTVGVVVLNNSTVTGLASRAADAVRADGWTVRVVGNLTGRSPATIVYYPQGRADAARALAATVGAGSVQPRPDGLPGPGDALVLVVTSDFGG